LALERTARENRRLFFPPNALEVKTNRELTIPWVIDDSEDLAEIAGWNKTGG
jgi:hypothetical protein